MTVRYDLIQICKDNHCDNPVSGDVDPTSWENSADDILAEFHVYRKYSITDLFSHHEPDDSCIVRSEN